MIPESSLIFFLCIDKFLDLKLGVDYDIWSLDASSQPNAPNAPWSLPLPARESTTKGPEFIGNPNGRWLDSHHLHNTFF